MNLRDKLRAVGGSSGQKRLSETVHDGPRDCAHTAVYRPAKDFPGAMELRGETLAMMSGKEIPTELDPRRILYLDTETTGLGGSGTVAFLIGMGWLTDEGFEVHQFLMRDYPEEPYLLKHVAAGLERFDALCTFNGSTFDVPLLESRFLMNRMDRSVLDLPHLDLLHMSRRLWKLRLGRCNLGRLEEVILGQGRQEDLPGSEVPQRYFTYLKTKQESLLEDILKHNAQDIISLCVLLNHMADLYLHPEKIHFSEDVYSMGRALERNRHPERARVCYRLASRGKMSTAASAALAASWRRAGNREEAARIWREMVATGRGGIGPMVELAKYEEHFRKNLPEALKWTEKAMARISEPGLGTDMAVQEAKKELQYRHQRLRRKMQAVQENGAQTDG